MERNTAFSLLITIVLLFLVIFFVAWGLNIAAKMSCAATANQMEFDYKYSIVIGCMIDVDGQWIPIGNYRVLE